MQHRDHRRVEEALRYLDRHRAAGPGLEELARFVGLSPFHLQRLFQRWAGVSPKRYLQHRLAVDARRLLAERRTVLATAHGAGLSGPGRLHDLLVTVEAMTPGEVRAGGAGLELAWGVHPSPFGACLVARTARGICGLEFDVDEAEAWVGARWPGATAARDDRMAEEVVGRLAAGLPRAGEPLALHLAGTNFQLQVWRALLAIPEGRVATYGDVARALGRPRASRAVGSAVGANPVAWLIPCHRVLRASGGFGGYRWGEERKRALLAWEDGGD